MSQKTTAQAKNQVELPGVFRRFHESRVAPVIEIVREAR